MRLTIVNDLDGEMSVGIDEVFFSELDSSQLPSDIHAIQWYESYGDVEYKDADTGAITRNESITSINDYQFAIDAWNAAKDAHDAMIAEMEAQAQQAEQPVE